MLEQDITSEQFKKKWEVFLKNEKELWLDRAPIATVFLVETHNRKSIRLKVNWDLFFEYLEKKAKTFVNKVRQEASIIKEAYNEILGGFYFSIRGQPRLLKFEMERLKQRAYEKSFENFRRLLLFTGDYDEILVLMKHLFILIDHVEEVYFQKNEASIFFTSTLKMGWQGLLLAFEILNIPACYSYLRNLMEHAIKLLIYEELASKIQGNKEVALALLFQAERGRKGGRQIHGVRDFREWKKNMIKKLARILALPEERWNKKIPSLYTAFFNLSASTFEVICKEYDFPMDSVKLWQACSEIIHSQPPLPFYSLLEVKVFKQFLKYYIEVLANIFPLHISLAGQQVPKQIKKGTSSKLHRIASKFRSQFFEELEQEIQKVMKENSEKWWFDPWLLSALFLIWSPSFTTLYKQFFTQRDIERIAKRIQPLTFYIGLTTRVREVLDVFYKSLIPRFEKLSSEFGSLKEEEKEIVTFWILVDSLPRVVRKACQS
ncbi:MAG: hypothetical protein J7L59_02860 [Nanoarchaeota archaeon]|nr:hypothetical protein [Nanoarchaeota archaeon]